MSVWMVVFGTRSIHTPPPPPPPLPINFLFSSLSLGVSRHFPPYPSSSLPFTSSLPFCLPSHPSRRDREINFVCCGLINDLLHYKYMSIFSACFNISLLVVSVIMFFFFFIFQIQNDISSPSSLVSLFGAIFSLPTSRECNLNKELLDLFS